ncbi:MAG: iron-containing alcohol dehydrogenase [Paludibacter sp.]|nr:iron-containing alcohol dehydrogenase [Bacteroidales bacterium]MCM1069294.1 iron-containing alcohol dehydrogenase [Prevotella sp.]MCM1353723.1 iron-containing alcohol dehydrogenase [Bacteroides sp.]MCM1442209.1 iron-containing alcohol dehydrogenase [Muribaculum sp.]MCM1482171.1 iron-containing alcohol dehydrogenase [Paludibacter sp.]
MNCLRKLWCRTFQGVFYLALPVLPYRDPKQFNSLTRIPEILQGKKKQRVLIVTDQGLVKAGIVKQLEDVLNAAQIAYTIYADTVANPTIDNVEAARQQYLDFDAQAIIALGGGSSMDCAKAAGARIVKPKQSIPQMKGILRVHKRLPLLIAIPTTAGTGSETTLAAVITDSRKHHKYPINDFSLIPHYAILDWHLTTGLPKHITATTGMDALTHAVEAYIGGSTTKQTRAMAENATRLIHRYLYRAYEDGNDGEARQKMLRAAYCAGIAFSKSYVGYVHAVAHSLGGKYGTPHGLANAILLPIVLKEYGSAVYKKLARLARNAGVVTDQLSDEDTAKRFIAWIEEMNAKMDIPATVADIREEDIPEMATHADAEGNPLYPVPVLMDRQELEHLYYLAKTNR